MSSLALALSELDNTLNALVREIRAGTITSAAQVADQLERIRTRELAALIAEPVVPHVRPE